MSDPDGAADEETIERLLKYEQTEGGFGDVAALAAIARKYQRALRVMMANHSKFSCVGDPGCPLAEVRRILEGGEE